MTKEELIKELKPYIDQIYFINDCYTAYFSLFDSINEYNNEINLACGFFTIAKYCISKVLFIEIAKIFERKKVEMTIIRLNNILKANMNLLGKNIVSVDGKSTIKPKDFTDSTEKFFDENQEVLNYIKSRRDKVFAHNDLAFYKQNKNMLVEYPVQADDIRALIDFMNGYINSLSDNLQNKVYNFNSVNTNDLPTLLNKIGDTYDQL